MPPSNPARRQNRAEEITRQIRAAIVLGEIAPGTPLAEPVLAARYGVSRAPIREALIALERDGLVEFNERSRTRVSPLSAEDFHEICTMRMALESMAARLVARIWAPEYTRIVEENLVRQEAAETLGELSHLDVEMHEYIVRLSGHRRLIKAWLGIRWQFEMGLAYTHRLQQTLAFEPRRITVDSHRRLLAALASGDPALAESTMAAHIEGSLEWSLAKFPIAVEGSEALRKRRASSAPATVETGEVEQVLA